MDVERAELLVQLLTAHHRALFRYIFALLPDEEDARDVLQETSLALYHKFDGYDPTKPFLTWAYQFAYLEVLKQLSRNQRWRSFDRELVQQLAREREEHEPVLEKRLRALDCCLAELPPADRDLIRRRYGEKTRADDLGAETGVSRRTLFRQLDRIRRLLHYCINRRLTTEG